MSVAPRLRSNLASRSFATDFEICSRRAPSVIDPASAMATKARTDSSFSIVRDSRTLVSQMDG
jgi:hypothetical protein